MSEEFKLKRILGGKLDLFSRGSFQMFSFLVLFSPAFTSMFKENVLLYLIFAILITINNLGVEYYAIIKKGPKPKDYMSLFLKISLPSAVLILAVYLLL